MADEASVPSPGPKRRPRGDADLASVIAAQLGETHPAVLAQIRALVRRCGAAQVQTWQDEALAIEAQGGMLTNDGTRRRTVGGVFFAHVVGALMTAGRVAELAAIGRHQRRPPSTARADGPATPAPRPAPPVPVVAWAARADVWAQVARVGAASALKFRAVVLPLKTLSTPAQTLLPVVHRGALPQAPRGMPLPPEPVATSYLAAIGGKAWREIGERAADAPLVLKGFAYNDTATGAVRLITLDPPTVADPNPKLQLKAGETRAPVWTVIGTVGTPLVRPDVVFLRVTWQGPLPAAPKGIAVPTTISALEVGVMVSAKLWRKQAAAALADDADTKLMIEGPGYRDRELGMLIIYASGITVAGRKPVPDAPVPPM